MAELRQVTRAQFLLAYLLLTAAIATGLALYSSATAVIELIRTATSGILLPLLLALMTTFLLERPSTSSSARRSAALPASSSSICC